MSSASPALPLDPDAETLARSGWIAVQHGQIRGLMHAFGDCMHALEMLTGSLTPGVSLTAEAIAAINAESMRGAELVRLLRLVPFADRGEREACIVSDAVRDCVRLFELHADARDAVCDVEIGDDVPAVLAPPSALLQALLAVLTEALPTRLTDAPARAFMRVHGDESEARIEIAWSQRPAVDPHRATATDPFVIARWLLRSTGATFVRSLRGTMVSTGIRLPSLRAARATETAAR